MKEYVGIQQLPCALNGYNKATSFLFLANYRAKLRLLNKVRFRKQSSQFSEYYMNKVECRNMGTFWWIIVVIVRQGLVLMEEEKGCLYSRRCL